LPVPPLQADSPSLAAWLEVLDAIDRALESSLARAAEPAPPPAAPGVGADAARLALEALDGRLAQVQASLERAGQHAAVADAALTAEAEALERWLARAQEGREKLGPPASGAV
jgi:hypothetical protein